MKPLEQKAREYAADRPFCVGDVSPMLEAAYLKGAMEMFSSYCSNQFKGYAQGRNDEKKLSIKAEILPKAPILILGLIALLACLPSVALAQYRGYQGYQGYEAPVIVAPQIGRENVRSFDRLLVEQSRNLQAETALTRERIINERLGSNADNAAARSIVGTMIDSEMRARNGR